jgi:UDP-GlcNAc:undecaprenyl-phosphate GlcNAc-1-phosphate transferase
MREYLVVFLVAAAATYLLTVIAREFALRTHAVAEVRDRDVHAEPIPYLGGLAMMGGLVAAYLVGRELPFLSRADPYIFEQARAVLIAGAVICAVGVLDDIVDLDALTKFGGQVLAAGILVWQGVQYTYVPQPSGGVLSLDLTQGALLTVFIVVATANAVNFVDGLDGLAAGVVGAGALAFFAFCYLQSERSLVNVATTGALLSAALAGVCAGFMPHNFHPARLFMGDSGSMLIGLVLAASTIALTGQFSADDLSGEGGKATLLPILLPISILIVPLADMVLAVFRRTRAGLSPFAPDKLHLHHRMLEFGHSHRRAVLIMWLWAGLVGTSIVLLSLYRGGTMWMGFGLMVAVTVALTFALPRVRGPHPEHPPATPER